MEFGGLSLSLKFEFQKTLPSLLTVGGSYVPAAEQQISAVGLTIYMTSPLAHATHGALFDRG